jgi:peroxiredoxin (alkyl hydroperoxide reductase subunit C)
MKVKKILLFIFTTMILANPLILNAQVLGGCGSQDENEPGAALKSKVNLDVQQVLLPGERAINFELISVVGDEIKNVKLSDYNGKWRVICFYPADFTFV